MGRYLHGVLCAFVFTLALLHFVQAQDEKGMILDQKVLCFQTLKSTISILGVRLLLFPSFLLGFVTLDCGLLPDGSPYVDPSTGLTFTSDASFVESGKNGRVDKDSERIFEKALCNAEILSGWRTELL